MTKREAWYLAWRCLRNASYQDYTILPPPARDLYIIAFRLYMLCYGKRSMTSKYDAFHVKLKHRLRSYKEFKRRQREGTDPTLPF